MSDVPLMKLRDVARLLNVSPGTAKRYRKQGILPLPVQIGGALRWRRSDVLRWLGLASQAGLTGTDPTIDTVREVR
jgi:predicted DNA-binding transcriptional regulator AlpA